ncbi:hypothetical protein NITMOv2_3065 [Nitrospira moscoviensis]|uniref:Uncharacterized protein n=1 Tax=Nitrospira moscoviensis TaxID=42253 RepID=A0A0K2GF45_NITMO|nr:hypothetical protein NITMOv2_3065 [Nitrospira moscoviensis]
MFCIQAGGCGNSRGIHESGHGIGLKGFQRERRVEVGRLPEDLDQSFVQGLQELDGVEGEMSVWNLRGQLGIYRQCEAVHGEPDDPARMTLVVQHERGMGVLQNVVRNWLAVEEEIGGPPGTVLKAAVANQDSEAVRMAEGLPSLQLVRDGLAKGFNHADKRGVVVRMVHFWGSPSCRSLHDISLEAEDKRTEHRVIESALGTSAIGRTDKDQEQRGAAWRCRVKPLCRYTNDLKPAEASERSVRTGWVRCDWS